ncbi:MAG: fatty acid desaturase [Crocinitomicaceae bacterium]
MSINIADQERIKRITLAIRQEHERLRSTYSWLKFQNFIGFGLLIVSTSMILCFSWLWHIELISTWFLVIWVAFWTSILHELEHDLIHGLYFKKSKFITNVMFGVVWIFRPLTLNPWIRKYWHHHHHQHSGKVIDIEERGVTNGERWSLKRLIMTPDLLLSFLFRCVRIFKEIKTEFKSGNLSKKDMKMLRKTLFFGFMPIGIPAYLIFYFWIFLGVSSWFGIEIMESTLLVKWSSFNDPLIYVLILPNYIRQFCLHFITSNMHFYGDVEDGDMCRQTQVLNAWWTWPFQLFCFNFGSTHSIHHFVVNEPFYTRQMSVKRAHLIFRKEGVKFNDTASFNRANSYE